ncbi:hypothetical protein [Nodularia spumigena]|uniref:hypothetical protein n=1 Tax=Nodularia spumigena TaxID=70799 RepID=UPI00232D5640|nr:hypothetical protein [Nodularia spumigena]MDB9318211.1 hypothetical protein [Nodularia spumigena CS-590/01A]MDB9325704.1 hypothetical protein [Nodularia spumigena CS-590/02]MDB9334321.1 hypothetical protein [Nodularia spumigena CS-590/01]
MRINNPPPPPPPPHKFQNNDLRIICQELMELKEEHKKLQQSLSGKILWNVFGANLLGAVAFFILISMLRASSF